jgi:hypothetical protein
MDFAQIFYILGIIFFVVFTAFFVTLIFFIFYLYKKVKNVQNIAQTKVQTVMDMISSNKMAIFPIATTAISFVTKMMKKKMNHDSK